MMDRLPFPDVNAHTTEEKVAQLVDYLIRFKEELEFILSDIGVENLSADLQHKISEMGKPKQNTDEAEAIYIVKNEKTDITLRVNIETGDLEYEIS